MLSSKPVVSGKQSRTFDPRSSMISTKVDPPSRLLTSLRHRKSLQPHDINSELACKVVHDYILPMFSFDKKQKSNLKRIEQYGTTRHKRNFSEDKGTVFSELKLSDRLSEEIQKMKKEVSEISEKLKFSEQKQHEIQVEVSESKSKNLQDSATIKSLNLENIFLKNENQKLLFSTGFLSQQLFAFKSGYFQNLETSSLMSKELQEQKAINDIRLKIDDFFFNSRK